MRFFVDSGGGTRARRATDALVLIGASLALLLISLAAFPIPGFATALAEFLDAWPDLLDGLWQFASDLLLLVAIVLIVVALTNRRLALARDMVASVAVAVALGLVVGRITAGSWPDLWDSLRHAGPPPGYPSIRLAVASAVVFTVRPHLVLPARRLTGRLLFVAAIGTMVLGATTLMGAIAALLVATIGSAAVHLALGSSAGRPALGDVAAALAELGVDARSLGAAARQESGVFLVDAVGAAGEPLVVKVYGRDANDSALVSSMWRSVWFREANAPFRIGRLQQVEHEAFLTLLAGQGGIATDTVVTAGATLSDDALLVLRRDGTPLTALAPERLTPNLARHVWDVVDRLHASGIAHGQVDAERLMVFDSGLGIADFRGGTVAPTEMQRNTDRVQALVATALLSGTEVAIRASLDALGRDGVLAILPLLQMPLLTPRQRREVREGALDLDDLRAAAATAVTAEPPALLQVRRVTLGTVVSVLLPGVALLALLSGLAEIDFQLLFEQLADANWWLVVLGFLVTQTPRLAQAMSTLGASPIMLPLGPVYALQLATSYINIAIPTAAGRIALSIRFFQRHGVAPGAALATGALDGFSGFIAQALLLVGLLLFTPTSIDLQLEQAGSVSAARIAMLVLAIAVLAIGLVLTVPRWRRLLREWAGKLWHEGIAVVRGLRSPRRIALLLGGSIAAEVLFAIGLGTFTRALGYDVGLPELLLVNITVSLFSGLIPVPGGIGVVEGGLTVGLISAGMSEEMAFAAAILYRLASFYVPPVWGYFALQWMERNDHV